jgi:hypothetical protein
MSFSFKSMFRNKLERWRRIRIKKEFSIKHTLVISIDEVLKFFLVKFLIVNEIWASAIDNASRFIWFETAEAVEDDIWAGMINVLMLL